MDKTISQRLDELERQNRRWRRGSAVFAIVGALVVVAGAWRGGDTPRVVEAERFVVKGKGDKPRAVLEAVDGGSPRLVLLDEGGKTRLIAALSADGKMTVLDLNDGREKPRLSVQLVDDVPKVAFIDKDGTTRCFIHLGLGDFPQLVMSDGDGDMRFMASLVDKNGLTIACPDKTNPLRSVFTLSTDQKSRPRLAIANPDGQLLFHVP